MLGYDVHSGSGVLRDLWDRDSFSCEQKGGCQRESELEKGLQNLTPTITLENEDKTNDEKHLVASFSESKKK